ncbi:tRNA methyltransferase [Ignavibacterium album JCM 16511]|uniref:tRNA (guanosine(18)-2'-O)-methyltransferase n=1 Tax=Ignavibacterium album (strain DSM 19864 / JCM 16511 / NBRC 101810 / Mat9-16) TaxID=945713 RepID=I0AKK5_IGNAJ|nr:RNA methyltransferase [Ignavibacterium album]AFH49512.1 tRNA methyltransferase [Ignavibacterium album JCM 16511]
MKEFKSEKRLIKITNTLKRRQYDLMVVLENIHDPHNVSAIFRTCDAVGIPKVSLVYTKEKFPKIGKKSSASAFKWVEKQKFTSIDSCYSELRKNGFKIYASSICSDSKSIYEIDFTGKVAIVLGNEHRGVSEKADKLADERIMIPMFGMVQSLNVSVAAAIILYEAARQRIHKGEYEETQLKESELEKLVEQWCKK